MAQAADEPPLRVRSQDAPRALFFRAAEAAAARPGAVYEAWRDEFSRLDGIIGKTLDEEIPGRSSNIAFFTRFKKELPEQVVLLHCNGNARDPRWEGGRFFAGHWLYMNGATLTAAVEAEEGESLLHVANARLFKTGTGRYRNANEDIGLCILGEDGKPDWSRSEQAQLVSVDVKAKTLRVKRGCYGTRPLAFPAGRAYAAAHMTEGPWGKNSNLLWLYNYATCCPKDSAGRTCADIWSAHLGELFNAGGLLAAYDGLEFDVLHNQAGAYEKGQPRGADCDADGQPDGGVVNGANAYGAGVTGFCRQLRATLGEGRIIQADGASASWTNQRAFSVLNGIESEGFPWLGDKALTMWSSGINRHLFWAVNGRTPVFNYINHKFVEPSGIAGEPERRPDVPMGCHRLVFAAGVFTDAALCYAFEPPSPKRFPLAIWDELVCGTENRPGWLGKALGPALRLAERQPDLLRGRGRPVGSELLTRFVSDEARIEWVGGKLRVSATDPQAQQFHFKLKAVACEGPDLFVSLTAHAEVPAASPRELARLLSVTVAGAKAEAGRPVLPTLTKNEAASSTFLNAKPFQAGFQLSSDAPQVDLEFTCELAAPVWVDEIAVYAGPDAMARVFEHGLVLANPSLHPVTFDLGSLAPGKRYRHFKGTASQDPKANDGSPVGAMLTLPPKDAAFLVQQ